MDINASVIEVLDLVAITVHTLTNAIWIIVPCAC